MNTARVSKTPPGWLDLSYELAVKVGILFLLAAWIFGYTEITKKDADLWLLLPLLLGALASLLIAWRGKGRLLWTTAALVVMPLVSLGITCDVLGYVNAALLLAIPVALSGLLVEPASALPTAAMAILILLRQPQFPQAAVLAQSLALALTGLVTWVVADGLRTNLWHAWREAEHVTTLMREVRLHQEEVNRLNKALQVSNGLLKRSVRELAQAQREAAEARHLKEQFATTVSHELRTPLGIILGFLEVMQRYPEVYGEMTWPPRLRHDIDEIQNSAQYLAELVDDILDLARIEALKMPIHREHVAIADVVREATSLASRILASKAGVSLRTVVPEDLPDLFIDRTRIRQVLLNLLANACRFTEQGSITVSAALQEDQVVLAVADTGPGIPPDQLGSIFDEFRQADQLTLSEQHRAGKGLGLAIAKRFVQLHGGRIWAESEVSRGSTFYFSLPLSPKQLSLLGVPVAESQLPGEERPMLVLVGEPEARALLERRLEGYVVAQVPDLAEARKFVRQNHPYAVIVGAPPESEGAQQGSPPPTLPEPVPVIQCTLPASSRVVDTDLFDAWLTKPIDSDRLRQALAQYPSARELLLVDDDRSFVRLLRRLLEAQGDRYRVSWAYDEQEALAKLRQQPVDVVLLDIALPGASGYSIAKHIREGSLHDLPIIAVTAMRPGLDGLAHPPHTFAVTTSAGLSESDTLALLRSCLACVRPAYGTDGLTEPEWASPA